MLTIVFISSSFESVAQLTQKIECQVTMDCCTVDPSPEHSCCCDITESESQTDTPTDDFIVSSGFKLFVFTTIIKTLKLEDSQEFRLKISTKENLANSPPKLIQNTISYIYFNSSLPLG